MTLSSELRARIRAWMDDDPDAFLRSELRELLDENNAGLLSELFSGPIAFGTAGLRAKRGPGPSRMNLANVLRATVGFASYVKKEIDGAEQRGIVIGCDARHRSQEFARAAAETIAALDVQAHIFPFFVPTPIVAFALRELKAAAAIVLTASHNPKEYCGYKVFWENGAQIIPPHDAYIANRMAKVESVRDVSRSEYSRAVETGAIRELGHGVVRNYFDAISGLRPHPEVRGKASIAYTALHGVGHDFVSKLFSQNGFENFYSVQSQAAPDPDFPTVEFPNPEESGAMDLLLSLANENETDLAIANDPDADRLALAVRHDDAYITLTGNDVGCLIANYLLSEGLEVDKPVVINTVASSPLLGRIAEGHDAAWHRTLIGLKWVLNKSFELEKTGHTYVCGYEEALGYASGRSVADKDGISAALIMADYASWAKSNGQTLIDELRGIWRRYGFATSRLLTETHDGVEGQNKIAAIMRYVRAHKDDVFGDLSLIAFSDFSTSERHDLKNRQTSPLDFPESNICEFEFEGGTRVMLRPSGTEPKLKAYFNFLGKKGEPWQKAEETANALLDRLQDCVRQLFRDAIAQFDAEQEAEKRKNWRT